jgi:hypothetical protein
MRRIRPAEALALPAGLLLGASLFAPWFGNAAGREDAWSTVAVPAAFAALAALAALGLIASTVTQRSAALPLVFAVSATVLGAVALVLVAVSAADLPGGATERCYGLWLGVAGCVGVLVAAWLSMRDERPLWGVAVSP